MFGRRRDDLCLPTVSVEVQMIKTTGWIKAIALSLTPM
jgi:hypothetical protein